MTAIEGIVKPTSNGGLVLNYGKQARRLAEELGFDKKIKEANPELSDKLVAVEAKKQAQVIIDLYFEKIPGVKKFISDTQRQAAETKYVETLSGRRRWLHELMDIEERICHDAEAKNDALLNRIDPSGVVCWCDDCREARTGERKAVNTIIQGSAADVAQDVMIQIHESNDLRDVIMLFQVHDEITFEIPTDMEKEGLSSIKEVMENPRFDLSVPLRCSPGIGNNWTEAK